MAILDAVAARAKRLVLSGTDRKSTRLNSSHGYISYAVFCLKKKETLDRLADGAVVDAQAIVRLDRPEIGVDDRREQLQLPYALLLFFFKEPGAPRIHPFFLPGPFSV